MSGVAQVETAVPGLVASTPQRLPFAPQLEIRAFVLRRDAGNVLVYASGGVAHDLEALRDLGGVRRQLLNHWHEAMFASDGLDAPVFVHADDRAATEERLHVRASFRRRHVLDGDLEVIPTPGHTPGATAYLWDSGEHRILFTGDTVLLRDGEWVAAVLPSSDRAAYVESLDLLRDLDFDVLVPWAATAGQPWYARTDERDRRTRIGAILDRLWRGGHH